MAKRQKPVVRHSKSRSGALPLAARASAGASAGPNLKSALDGCLRSAIRGPIYAAVQWTDNRPSDAPKTAVDRFAANIRSALAAYDIASKLIG